MRAHFCAVFFESDHDIAALSIRAGDPVCVPVVGASDPLLLPKGTQSHKHRYWQVPPEAEHIWQVFVSCV